MDLDRAYTGDYEEYQNSDMEQGGDSHVYRVAVRAEDKPPSGIDGDKPSRGNRITQNKRRRTKWHPPGNTWNLWRAS